MARPIALIVSAALALPTTSAAQAPARDPEVRKGIAEVDAGDYDPALVRLDAAARRLARDPARRADLVQAYVYLGVAYLAKGHETSAKNSFRDALAHDPTLRLSPEKFAPRVVDLFEKARDQAAGKKGGGSKTPILIGVGAVAVGGAALALAGGGGGADVGDPTGADATGSFGVLLQRGFSGLTPGTNQFFDLTVAGTGTLAVTVDWGAASHDIDVYLATPACTNSSAYPPDVCAVQARAESATAKPEMFRAPVTPGPYRIVVSWCGDPACGTGTEAGTVQAVLERP